MNRFSLVLVIPLVAAAACKDTGGNNNGSPDAPQQGNPDAPNTRIDAPQQGNPDAPSTTDGSIQPSGVFAMPLSTPTGQDQGEFYTPTLTASGKNFLLDLDTGSTTTGIAGSTCSACTGMSPLYSAGR